jgi:hypothetical protein
MKLYLNKNLFMLLVGVVLLCFALKGMAQSPGDITGWQQKYRNDPVIMSTRRLDVNITMVNNAPAIQLESYKELVVLADNATYLSDSKEYFSNHFILGKLEAFSLIPERNQYKKLPVRTFNKLVELDGSIFYDDQYAYGFNFPSVGKGSRLVTRYTVNTSDAYLPVVFDFGGWIPAENMIITVTCPREVLISYHLFGKDTSVVHFSQSGKGNRLVYQWQASNPKSYQPDSEAPGLRYFLPHLIIQLAGYTVQGRYFPLIGSLKDLYAYNYSYLKSMSATGPSVEIKALADSITALCRTDREKVKSIFRWVQKNIKYVAIEDGDHGYVPREASLVLKRRYGDCKDKTSILVAMIRSQGLKSSYAWIGSRDLPYKYSQFASVLDDDHMIAVWWNEQDVPVILDGTTYSHSMENIPAFIQGKECMIEKGPDDFQLYTIPVARPKHNEIYDSVAIELKGQMVTGHGFVRFSGEQKAKLIAEMEGKDTSSWKELLSEQLLRASNKATINSIKLSDMTDVDAPFTIQYGFSVPDYAIVTNNTIYINLYLNRYLRQLVIREDRWMPVESDMTLDHLFVCSMQVPEGMKIKKLPDSTVYKNPGFGFRENYEGTGKQIILSSEVTINFQVIDGSDIGDFRDMLTILNRNYSKSLPLEKSETL